MKKRENSRKSNPDKRNRIIILVASLIVAAILFMIAGLSGSRNGSYDDPYYNNNNNNNGNTSTTKILYTGSNYLSSVGSKEVMCEFTPSQSGTYTIYSTGSYDTYATLYNSSKMSITSNDDGGSSYNFSISEYLTGGRTYYLGVKVSSSTSSASFSVYIER